LRADVYSRLVECRFAKGPGCAFGIRCQPTECIRRERFGRVDDVQYAGPSLPVEFAPVSDWPGRVGVSEPTPLDAPHGSHPFVHDLVARVEDSLGELKVGLVPYGLPVQDLDRSLDHHGLTGFHVDATNVSTIVSPEVYAVFECVNRRGRGLTFSLKCSVNVFGNKIRLCISLPVPRELPVGFLKCKLCGYLGTLRIDQLKLGLFSGTRSDKKLTVNELILLVGDRRGKIKGEDGFTIDK
jgi:hypothetical protein